MIPKHVYSRLFLTTDSVCLKSEEKWFSGGIHLKRGKTFLSQCTVVYDFLSRLFDVGVEFVPSLG